MASSTAPPNLAPPKDEALPKSYAVHVGADQIHVWQYQVTLSEQGGEWTFHETLPRESKPRLSLQYAELQAPTDNGYWVFSKAYKCALECE